MKFLETHSLLISTLSPVHIGCGEDYDPTRYVIENNTLYEFEPSAAQKVLTIQDQQELLRIVSNTNNQKILQEVQAFFYQRREKLIVVANRRVLVSPKIVAFYQKRVGKTVQVEGDGAQLLNRLEIERTFFNPANGTPVLPGSSLKGAMRTALLDGMNHGRSLLGQKSSLDLQKRLFHYDHFEQDPMRLIQLMDAAFMDEVGVGSELRFAVNRRRKAPKPGDSSTQSQAEQRNLYQLLECMPAAQFRVFAGQLTVQQVDSVNDELGRLPAVPLRWNLAQIATACNRFYRLQLEKEIQHMQERNFLNRQWAKLIEALLHGSLGQRLEKNQAFLLRVGRHSGAESVTLDGVRSIKILLGKDSATGKMRSENRATGTSWWLAASEIQDRNGMLPFGWLLVECHPVHQAVPDWPEVQEALAGLSTDYAVWINRERKLAEIAARRQAEAQAQRDAIAVKATLSPEQKAIDELQDWFEMDRKTKQLKPMGRVVGTLNRLLKEGTNWPLIDRQALANLAEKIFSQKSVGGDERLMEERKMKIQKLRENI